MRLSPTPYTCTKQAGWHWDKVNKCFSAEASTLGMRPGHAWDQLYDDACDVGMHLFSPGLNERTAWYLCEGETQRDAEGDVLAWVLKPCVEDVRKWPKLEGYTLKIFND